MDDQTLQNLLRSRKCELPSADAVERFIDEFHRRQSLLAMKSSFFEKVQESIENFFSHFRFPALAYVSVTAIALVLSIVILRSPRLNQRQGINPLFSEELEAPFNYISSPNLQQWIEPTTFELKKNNHDSNSVISPLSFILKQKSTSSSTNTF